MSDNNVSLGSIFLENSIKQFKEYKNLAEMAFAQISDDNKLFLQLDPESNSIAILIKHLSGNMKSRWSNVFTSDGEKPDRNRPQEFDRNFHPTRSDLMELWNSGWKIFLDALESFSQEDLQKTIYIRNEPHSLIQAIIRQLTHYPNHIGQILFISKHLEWEHWKHVTLDRNTVIFDINKFKKTN
jgi:hypothetical protein